MFPEGDCPLKKREVRAERGKVKHHKILLAVACILIGLAVVLLIWMYLAQVEAIRERYAELQEKLTYYETVIASLENKWLLVLIVFFLYALKSFGFFAPLSGLFIIPGMVFKVQYATAINIIGVSILISIRYYWGNKHGGGSVSKLISKVSLIRDFLKLEDTGNPWVLFLARLLPIAPVNAVSRLYGASETPYDKYLLISLLGFAPRILSFSVLGRNVFDPFSVGFLLPIVIMLFISGVSMFLLDYAIYLFGRHKKAAERSDTD